MFGHSMAILEILKSTKCVACGEPANIGLNICLRCEAEQLERHYQRK